MFEIEYDLTREDYIEYNMNHMATSKTMKRTLFIQQYIISLMFIVAPFFFVRITKAPFKFWLTVFLITYLLWVIFYPKYFKLVVKRRINKMLDEGKQENLFGRYSILITHEGILENSNMGQSNTNWNAVERLIETEEYIYIYISPVNAYIVPKRVFQDAMRKSEFINLIEQYSGVVKENL
ncbi:YcxB family protein [Clostridium sp. OS1-26]|uniref:YcxB family protein n=1 Tax=Clostridium sp. OS1-26 TaxID=3070681 RepID=UPI0027DFC861|nr:YcxB family protein [Clostridium sp. OS1-26]WML32939.1 YcxB family protein [Clostridium sp. OS1-26]